MAIHVPDEGGTQHQSASMMSVPRNPVASVPHDESRYCLDLNHHILGCLCCDIPYLDAKNLTESNAKCRLLRETHWCNLFSTLTVVVNTDGGK